MKAVLVLIVAIAFAVSPLLTPDFGGFDPDLYPVPQSDPPVQPAGYAFSIWGPIYLWLLVHAAFGVWKRREAADWDRTRLPLTVSLAVGAAWLPVALVSPLAATAMIWVMLITALVALVAAPRRDRWLARAPLGLYAGWLTAASCVSIGLVLAGWGWTSQSVAAWISLLVALALGAAMLRARPAPGYGLALVWALIAVAVQNWNRNADLVALAAVGAILIAGLTVVGMRAQRKARPAA
ncbi:TspO/MBR family protein [Oceaniglobus indicus]|uniref:TspO/MBR family protein n=1 Tax=Oceaniglobus indicus TaxID=2047749 RepID=UPI000C176E91|nr:TspO/MBR family protein [Oceaniglobus indicus]